MSRSDGNLGAALGEVLPSKHSRPAVPSHRVHRPVHPPVPICLLSMTFLSNGNRQLILTNLPIKIEVHIHISSLLSSPSCWHGTVQLVLIFNTKQVNTMLRIYVRNYTIPSSMKAAGSRPSARACSRSRRRSFASTSCRVSISMLSCCSSSASSISYLSSRTFSR